VVVGGGGELCVKMCIEKRMKLLFVLGLLCLLFMMYRCRQETFVVDEYAHESRGEKRCRRYLESRYGVKFVRARPEWLKNPLYGKNLELDCYNEQMRLAVEYNGIQHYKYTPVFHKKKGDLAYTRYKDRLKADMCRANGVRLVVVPYHVKNIEEYLSGASLPLSRNDGASLHYPGDK
jgi:hypothetical protein